MHVEVYSFGDWYMYQVSMPWVDLMVLPQFSLRSNNLAPPCLLLSSKNSTGNEKTSGVGVSPQLWGLVLSPRIIILAGLFEQNSIKQLTG